jgi:hypothetical protein
MKKLFLAVLFVFTFSQMSYAEPGITILRLMDEPASLFDIGMIRTSQYVEKYCKDSKFNDGKVRTHAYYVWDINRIHIQMFAYIKKTMTKKSEIIGAKKYLSEFKEQFGINPGTGEYTDSDYNSSQLANLFSHSGYDNRSLPKNFGEEIDKIIRISIQVYDSNHDMVTDCDCPLLSPEFAIVCGQMNPQ